MTSQDEVAEQTSYVANTTEQVYQPEGVDVEHPDDMDGADDVVDGADDMAPHDLPQQPIEPPR